MQDAQVQLKTLRREQNLSAKVTGIEAIQLDGTHCYDNYDPPYTVLYFPNEKPEKVRYISPNMEYTAAGRNMRLYFEEVAEGRITVLCPSGQEPDDPAEPFIESVTINHRTI